MTSLLLSIPHSYCHYQRAQILLKMVSFIYLTSLKSQTRDPKLKVSPGGLVLRIFTSWKNPSTSVGVWTREPWISMWARYPENTEADINILNAPWNSLKLDAWITIYYIVSWVQVQVQVQVQVNVILFLSRSVGHLYFKVLGYYYWRENFFSRVWQGKHLWVDVIMTLLSSHQLE